MSLAVICSHFNPSNYQEPRRNLMRFLRQMKSRGIPVFVSELAYDNEPFFLPDLPPYFQYRTSRSNILWHKENLLNQTVRFVPERFDKIAWIDPDIWFMQPDWYLAAEKALDRWPMIQLFRDVAWTDQAGRISWQKQSCASSETFDLEANHPGFAWAARRDLWETAGGLCDRAILGAGDSLVAAACANAVFPEVLCYPSSELWTKDIKTWVHGNGGVGYIDGLVVHEWHGDLACRSYTMRHQILAETDIDSILVRRPDGLLEFSPHASLDVIEKIRSYFDLRKEDG